MPLPETEFYVPYVAATVVVVSEAEGSYPDQIFATGDQLIGVIAGLLSRDRTLVSIWDDYDFDYWLTADSKDASELLKIKLVVQAHMFVALLRWRVFVLAERLGSGDSMFNLGGSSHTEYLYRRLADRARQIADPTIKIGRWLH